MDVINQNICSFSIHKADILYTSIMDNIIRCYRRAIGYLFGLLRFSKAKNEIKILKRTMGIKTVRLTHWGVITNDHLLLLFYGYNQGGCYLVITTDKTYYFIYGRTRYLRSSRDHA